MKNTFGILLLICLIVPTTSTYIGFKFQQRKVKRQVKEHIIEGLDEEELVLLKFSIEETQTELHWEHDKEFEYGGEMYDVVETKIEKDSISFICWSDQIETQLNQQFSQLLQDVWARDIDHKKQQTQLFHFFQSLFYSSPSHWDGLPKMQILRRFHQAEMYTSLYFSPPVPPPIS